MPVSEQTKQPELSKFKFKKFDLQFLHQEVGITIPILEKMMMTTMMMVTHIYLAYTIHLIFQEVLSLC